MTKVLLILTTAGRLHWVEGAIESLRDPIDVLVVDDATPANIGIENFCKQKNLQFITKSNPKGVTDSWNIGYRYFKKHKYTYCILSNDDVQFAENFSRGLVKALNTKIHLTGPITNRPGDALHQWVRKLIGKQMDFKAVDEVQKALLRRYAGNAFQPCNFVNGFCLAFSTAIQRFAFDSKQLCDPRNVNVDGEHDLAKRVRRNGGKIAICRTSYVYHRKMGTYSELGWKKITGHRNRLWR